MNYLALLFDPKFWLGLMVWSLICFGAGDLNGSSRAKAAAEKQAAIHMASALRAQAEADAEVLAAERRLRHDAADTYNRFYKESQDAQAKTDRLVADLRAGIVRLRVPTVPHSCQAKEDTGGQTPSRLGGEGHSELTADAAIFLGKLLARGDTGIRKHAALVDRYESLRIACSAPETESAK